MTGTTVGGTDSYTALRHAQNAYNALMKESVIPALGIAKAEEDRLTDAEIALRIPDQNLRREFIRVAIAMFEANIRHHSRAATPLVVERMTPVPVLVSLIAAAIGYYFQGPVWALLAAAAGYWLGHEYSRSRFRQQTGEAEIHNELAPDWKSSIDKWELSIRELRAIRH